jgi:hypothetical protein
MLSFFISIKYYFFTNISFYLYIFIFFTKFQHKFLIKDRDEREIFCIKLREMLEIPNILPKDEYQDDVKLIHWYPYQDDCSDHLR